jgi:hypothetical protein
MKKLTQRDRVIQHINDFGSISSLEAFREYGITRLSAIIWTLRHEEEMPIDSIGETILNRYGDKVSFFHYYLKGSAYEKQLKEEGKI